MDTKLPEFQHLTKNVTTDVAIFLIMWFFIGLDQFHTIELRAYSWPTLRDCRMSCGNIFKWKNLWETYQIQINFLCFEMNVKFEIIWNINLILLYILLVIGLGPGTNCSKSPKFPSYFLIVIPYISQQNYLNFPNSNYCIYNNVAK